MAGSFAQNSVFAVDDSGSSGTTIAATLNGVAAGNLLHAHVGWGDPPATITCTVNDGTAYTTGAPKVRAGAPWEQSGGTFFKPNSGSGNFTATATFSSTTPYRRIRFAEIAGVATASVLDQTTGQVQDPAGTTTNSVSSGSAATTTNANDFLVGCSQNVSEVDPSTGTLSAGTNYTAALATVTMGLESRNVSSTGAYAATFTQSVDNSRITHIVIYKHAAAGGTTITPAAGSVVLTGTAPRIDRVFNLPAGSVVLTGTAPRLDRVFVLPAGSVVLTGSAPTQTLTVTPPAGSVVLTGTAPRIDRDFKIPAGSVVLNGSAPLIERLLVLPAGSVVLTGSAPDVTVGAGISITPPAGSVVLTSTAPVIELFFSIPAGSVVLTGSAPDVTSGDSRTITPGAGSLSLTSNAPTMAQLLNVPSGSVVLTGFAPFLDGSVVLVITQGGLVLTGFQPDVISSESVGGMQGAGKSRRRIKRRTLVTIDNETFVVSDENEAKRLLEAAAEQAEFLANAQANLVVEKRKARQKRDGYINRTPIKIDTPVIKASAEDEAIRQLVQEYQARLDAIYSAAKQQAEIALLAKIALDVDDDDAIALLLSE